jgi:hypothetical protein
MASGRMLKKNVSTSKKLSSLKSDSSRLVWTWLLAHLDVAGRFSGEPDVVKGSVVPRLKHLSEKRVEEILKELNDASLIRIYRVDGEKYLELTRFEDFQNLRVDREGESKIPEPIDNKEDRDNKSGSSPGVVRESSTALRDRDKDKDKLKEDKSLREETINNATASIFDKWNSFAEGHGLTKITGIEKGSAREVHLLTLAKKKEFNFDSLLEIIGKSPFLLGQIDSKMGSARFFVTFDWIINKTNYQKIVEGNYLERTPTPKEDKFLKYMKEQDELKKKALGNDRE